MEHLETHLDDLGLSLSSLQLDQFARYQSLLMVWNERFNLTAVRTPEEIQVRHFADSLSCSLATGDLNGRSLIDVGTGAGFPGLPLKIAYPNLSLVLLESVGKKGVFLQEVVSLLGLENVTIIIDRAEVLAHDPAHREQYDWAAARAVAHLSPLLEYLLPFCRIGGSALAQKGIRAAEELADAGNAIQALGGELGDLTPVGQADNVDSFLVVVKKVRETPARYPRRAGIPVKRPL